MRLFVNDFRVLEGILEGTFEDAGAWPASLSPRYGVRGVSSAYCPISS